MTGGQVCGVSGGPDWLFSVVLAGGGLALVYGLIWAVLLFSGGDAVTATRPPRWYPLVLLVGLVPVGLQVVENPVRELSLAAAAAVLCAPALATLAVALRQATATGVFPAHRAIPYGMFWVLLAVALLAAATAAAALAASIAMGHQVPC